MAPSSARSSSAAAPSSLTGFTTATASRSTLAEAAAAAVVEIFMHALAWSGDENPARVSRPSDRGDVSRQSSSFAPNHATRSWGLHGRLFLLAAQIRHNDPEEQHGTKA